MTKWDTDIPITPALSAGRTTKWPWREMPVGASFFKPGSPIGTPQAITDLGRKFISRKATEVDPETGEMTNGRRYWRIA